MRLIMNPDWVEKVQNGKEAEIETAIKTSKVSELELPEKLWGDHSSFRSMV